MVHISVLRLSKILLSYSVIVHLCKVCPAVSYMLNICYWIARWSHSYCFVVTGLFTRSRPHQEVCICMDLYWWSSPLPLYWVGSHRPLVWAQGSEFSIISTSDLHVGGQESHILQSPIDSHHKLVCQATIFITYTHRRPMSLTHFRITHRY